MKSLANRLFLITATALSLGGAAFGQNVLNADVPFAFHTPGMVSSAGHYSFRLQGSDNAVRVVSQEMGRSVVSIGYRLYRDVNAPVAPHLVFHCGETGCALAEIWTPGGGYGVPVSHVRDRDYVASIPLTLARK